MFILNFILISFVSNNCFEPEVKSSSDQIISAAQPEVPKLTKIKVGENYRLGRLEITVTAIHSNGDIEYSAGPSRSGWAKATELSPIIYELKGFKVGNSYRLNYLDVKIEKIYADGSFYYTAGKDISGVDYLSRLTPIITEYEIPIPVTPLEIDGKLASLYRVKKVESPDEALKYFYAQIKKRPYDSYDTFTDRVIEDTHAIKISFDRAIDPETLKKNIFISNLVDRKKAEPVGFNVQALNQEGKEFLIQPSSVWPSSSRNILFISKNAMKGDHSVVFVFDVANVFKKGAFYGPNPMTSEKNFKFLDAVGYTNPKTNQFERYWISYLADNGVVHLRKTGERKTEELILSNTSGLVKEVRDLNGFKLGQFVSTSKGSKKDQQIYYLFENGNVVLFDYKTQKATHTIVENIFP